MSAIPLTPLPDPSLISKLLKTAASRFVVEVVAECVSTNDALRSRPLPDGAALHVLIAHHQTAGRGRRGRSWESAPGQSLMFSCAWPLPAAPAICAALPLTVGLALAEAVEALGIPNASLKWPNDVLIDGQKLAGILVELTGQASQRKAIIGIGLNLIDTPQHPLPQGATALSAHLPATPAAETVLATILLRLEARLSEHRSSGFAALRQAWLARDAFAGLNVRIRGDEVEHLGVCDGVADDGALLLRTEETTLRILSGDVSLRPAA